MASRSTRWAGFLFASAARTGFTTDGIQLRLPCNLLDGLVAIEGGKKSKVGELYNEVPDGVADSLFLVALEYETRAAAAAPRCRFSIYCWSCR